MWRDIAVRLLRKCDKVQVFWKAVTDLNDIHDEIKGRFVREMVSAGQFRILNPKEKDMYITRVHFYLLVYVSVNLEISFRRNKIVLNSVTER
jgi:hypothetical protein